MARPRRQRTAHDAAFLDAIREAPEDNVPRLIYADWLSDQPDPILVARGELIRVQCQLAGLPQGDERRKPLLQRETSLLGRFSHRWWKHRFYCQTGPYVRGFIETFTFEMRHFLTYSDRAAAVHPVVHLTLQGAGPLSQQERDRLPNRLALVSLRSLSFKAVPAADASALLRAPALHQLVSLSLESTSLAPLPDDLRLPGVQTLFLNPAGAAVSELFRSNRLPALTALSITRTPVPPLSAWAALPSVRQLNLCELDPASVQHLLHSPLLPGVVELFFSGRELAPVICATLPSAPLLPSLRKLDLGQAAVGAEVLTGLLRAPGFALEELNVAGRLVYQESWGGGYWNDYYYGHDIVNPNVGPEGVLALARSPASASLRVLDVSHNNLLPETVRALAESPYLANLQQMRAGEPPGTMAAEAWQPLVARFGERLIRS
jgi:uncharacterized protein (TIGR02996 family)